MNKDQLSNIIAQILDESLWSGRFPVKRTERLERLAHPRHDPVPSKKNGIYRIHMEGVPILAYVGQSKDLRRRINELRGIYQDVMPFTDPHIAAPGLWAWSQMPPQRPYTVSFAVVDESSAYWRQGLEDFVIAHARWKLKRQLTGEKVWQTSYSPLTNFHKLPPGWISSSMRAKGFRGGSWPFTNESHSPSIAPIGDLDDPRDPIKDLSWGGHTWSAWCEPKRGRNVKEELQGLYRLRNIETEELLFIGHGSIDEAAKSAARMGTDLLFSYVVGPWSYHEQLELLADALGLYLHRTKSLPLAQYDGEENPQVESARPPRILITQTVPFLQRFVSVQQCRRGSVLYGNWQARLA